MSLAVRLVLRSNILNPQGALPCPYIKETATKPQEKIGKTIHHQTSNTHPEPRTTTNTSTEHHQKTRKPTTH
jgi:hypothetical protein